MNKWIELAIGTIILICLFLGVRKLGIKAKLINSFYKIFENFSAMTLHILAFLINFIVLFGIGLFRQYLNSSIFDMVAFPILLIVLLTLTTSLITVAKVKQTPKSQLLKNGQKIKKNKK